jgi:hypothetical protein
MFLLALAACGGNAPACPLCPPLEGRYALVLDAASTPETCPGVTVTQPQGPLTLAREGIELSGSLDGLVLGGNVNVVGDFSLQGSRVEPTDGGTSGPEAVGLTGRYLPAEGDGGVVHLAGQWQGYFVTTTAGTTRQCTLIRDFTATRQ